MLILNIKKFRWNFSSRSLLIICLTFLFTVQLSAQSKSQLENKRKKILDEIRYTERLLNNTKKDVQSNIANISALKRKISLREQLVGNLSKELSYIDKKVASNKAEIKKLNDQLAKLRENYTESIYKSYKYQKSSQQLLFVLGAENVNQAVRRMNYVRKISDSRKDQAKEIKNATKLVEKKVVELESMREEKQVLIAENNVQLKSLDEEKSSINVIVAQLKKQESKYKKEIGAKRKERDKLNKQIQAIIEREIELARKKAEEQKKKEGLANTPSPADLKLSKDFYANKGKLPWPVSKGYISRKYGVYRHAELGLEMNNTGVDIRTDDKAPVKSIFEGEVVTVMSNPTFKNAVIIKHGEYFSVYTGLDKVSVSKGSKVKTGQVIGSAYTEAGQPTEMHLEIWKGKTKTNPSTWILKH